MQIKYFNDITKNVCSGVLFELNCLILPYLTIYFCRRAKLGQIQGGGLQRAIQDSTKGKLQ